MAHPYRDTYHHLENRIDDTIFAPRDYASRVQEDMTLSLRELISRFSRGMPLPPMSGGTNAVYDDDGAPLPDEQGRDGLFDVEDELAEVTERLNEQRRSERSRSDRGDKRNGKTRDETKNNTNNPQSNQDSSNSVASANADGTK